MSENERISAVKWSNDVAPLLGDSWTVSEGVQSGWEHDAFLVGPFGERVHVSVGGYQRHGRITVRWSIPFDLHDFAYTHGRDGEPWNKEITMAVTKTATVAARDIARRLLPGLTEALWIYTERKWKRDVQRTSLDDYMRAVAAAVGADHYFTYDRRHHRDESINGVRFGNLSQSGISGEIEGYGGNDVQLELRMPRERALEVLRSLYG